MALTLEVMSVMAVVSSRCTRCASKIAAVSGDARRALQICRYAVPPATSYVSTTTAADVWFPIPTTADELPTLPSLPRKEEAIRPVRHSLLRHVACPPSLRALTSV
jgi:hypothetical protein